MTEANCGVEEAVRVPDESKEASIFAPLVRVRPVTLSSPPEIESPPPVRSVR